MEDLDGYYVAVWEVGCGVKYEDLAFFDWCSVADATETPVVFWYMVIHHFFA
jgi:hypothetical protein